MPRRAEIRIHAFCGPNGGAADPATATPPPWMDAVLQGAVDELALPRR